MNSEQIVEIFRRLQAHNPQPGTELYYQSPFELLICVMLSAQSTDKQVNQVTARLFPIARTPEQILALGEMRLKDLIKSIGLYNTKATNILKTCARLLEIHNGVVPNERSALEALPGVGRKTANVVLNTEFGEATIAVDTHVFRVANRTGLAVGKTVRAVEKGLLEVVPAPFRKDAHHWLVLHGRYICTARQPRCAGCPIRDLCPSAPRVEAPT